MYLMARKILIDTDPGIDDSMAIFFALKSPELDVIGLTTIFGNVHTDLATTNALRLLEIAGRTDIPVAKGADHAIAGPFGGPVPYVHGDDGQGNVRLPLPMTSPHPKPAAQFIVDEIMAQPGEITLVPIGPLTNVALALRLEPRITENVREVVLMGGNAFGPGNATPAAEANIHNDPEAADVVFSAPWQVTMVGLDVTHHTVMDPQHLARYKTFDNPLAQHIARIVPFYLEFYREYEALDGIYVHDPCTIAYLVDPSLFKSRHHPIRVDTNHSISRGKTWPSISRKRTLPPWHGRPTVNILSEVNAAGVVELELSRMSQ